MQLQGRLLQIAGMVRPGKAVADIGTDHGYLPVYLYQQGISPFVYACDVNPQPLAKAQQLIASLNLQKFIFPVLSNGLEKIKPQQAEDIVIAGMGAELIESIINRAPWLRQKEKHLVLQPMNGADKLRRFLYTGGFYIEKEGAVFERGHMYTVISAYYGSKVQQITDIFALCGTHLNQQEDGHSQAYLEHQGKKIKKILMQLGNAAQSSSNQEKRQYLEGLYSQLLQISHKEA